MEKILGRKNWRRWGVVLAVGVVVGLGVVGYRVWQGKVRQGGESKEVKNKEWEFTEEVFDLIRENYWQKLDENTLVKLYKQGMERLGGGLLPDKGKESKEDLRKELERVLRRIPEEKRGGFVVRLARVVLGSLEPLGRSGLYGQKEQEELRAKVDNVHKERDLYKVLEVEKGADKDKVEQAYRQKVEKLAEEKSASAAAKLEEVKYAYKVLADERRRKVYDTKGSEPTVWTEVLGGGRVYYVKIGRISPTTFEELRQAMEESGKEAGLEALIVDLRGNIGGAVDAVPYLTGPFIGAGQYAYEFFHQGELSPYKTRVERWLEMKKFRKVVILVDGRTQSSAELMAAVLKRYNVGVVVGERTKGWGTIERVFELKSALARERKLGVFLVHSLSLRDDNQPIEGNGVEPEVKVRENGWEEELARYIGKGVLWQEVRRLVVE